MTEKDKVREMMRGRRMCSVCDIARATGLDTEVVKPLMVDIAFEAIGSYKKPKRYLWDDQEEQVTIDMWMNGFKAIDIATYLGRPLGTVKNKISVMQRQGRLPLKCKPRKENQNADNS
ncbi:MAG: hypothetical protein ACI4J3_00790 [Oscillospiraceae bacterium]